MSGQGKSTVDARISPLTPSFRPSEQEPAHVQKLIDHLNLQKHVEGGYFVETDRDTLRVPNPFKPTSSTPAVGQIATDTRSASTTIYYFLSPSTPLGAFHRNKGRTIHTLHRGRGRYVIIHADEVAASACPDGYGPEEGINENERWVGKARVETFIVGHEVLNGERLQWIVEGGKYKASFLLPDDKEGQHSEGLLISETVVPGFEFEDHDFMTEKRFQTLLSTEQAKELAWMLRQD